MRGRKDALAQEFDARRQLVLANPEIPFVQDLRNFTLHLALPFVGHTVTLPGPADPEGTGADRDAAMTTLVELHEHVAAGLATMSEDDWGRKDAGHLRGSGGQPYPTSAADIKAWLTDHYFEHVPHVAELLQGWRAAAAGREVVR